MCVVLHAWFVKVDRIIKGSGSLIGQSDIGILVTLKHKGEIFCWRKGKNNYSTRKNGLRK